jgi:hypothetical protein
MPGKSSVDTYVNMKVETFEGSTDIFHLALLSIDWQRAVTRRFAWIQWH